MMKAGPADPTFRAIAETVVSECAQLDAAGWQEFHRIVEHALSQRPAKMRRQLALFIRVLNLLSLLKYRRALHSLQPAERTRFLERIQDSRLLLVRRGFWGLRTLILMGYYARPEARSAVGYRAHIHGWQTRNQGIIG